MAKARKKPPPRLYLLTIALVLTLADQKVSAADMVANPRVRKRDGSKLSREVCFGASIEFSSVCLNRFRLTGACVCNITAARGGRSGVVYIDLGRFPRHGSSPDSLEIFLRISQILPRSLLGGPICLGSLRVHACCMFTLAAHLLRLPGASICPL